jgi:hypothetical protein
LLLTVTTGKASSAGKLKNFPNLLKELRSDNPGKQILALGELATLTDTTSPTDDEVIGKTGIFVDVLKCLKEPTLCSVAVLCLIHMTLANFNREALAQDAEAIGLLVAMASEGDVKAETILNNSAPLPAVRQAIINTPGGKGVEVLAKLAHEKRQLYVKGSP